MLKRKLTSTKHRFATTGDGGEVHVGDIVYTHFERYHRSSLPWTRNLNKRNGGAGEKLAMPTIFERKILSIKLDGEVVISNVASEYGDTQLKGRLVFAEKKGAIRAAYIEAQASVMREKQELEKKTADLASNTRDLVAYKAWAKKGGVDLLEAESEAKKKAAGQAYYY